MKVVVIIFFLVAAVMLAIFVKALVGIAAMKTPLEQMLEDADQRRYIDAWMKRKHRSGVLDNTIADGFGQIVESSKTSEKTQ